MRNSGVFKQGSYQDAIQIFQTRDMRPTLFGIQSIQRRRQRQGICITNQELQIQSPQTLTIRTPSTPKESSEIRRMTKICLKNAVVKTYLQSYEPEKSADSNKQILKSIINQVSNEVRYPGKLIVKLPEIVTFVSLRQITIRKINILRLPTDICLSFPSLIELDVSIEKQTSTHHVSTVLGKSLLFPNSSTFQLKNLEFEDLQISETHQAHPGDLFKIPALPWYPMKEKNRSLQSLSTGLITLPELHQEEEYQTGVLETPVISQAECSAAIQQALAFNMPASDKNYPPKPSETFGQLTVHDPTDSIHLPDSVRMALISKEPSRRGGRRGSVFHQFGFPATTFV